MLKRIAWIARFAWRVLVDGTNELLWEIEPDYSDGFYPAWFLGYEHGQTSRTDERI